MPTQELLDVRDALVVDNRARIVELIDPLVDAFDGRRDREEALSSLARQLDVLASPGTDAESAAVDVLTSAREAATARSQLTTVLSGYLNGQEDSTTAVATAEKAIAKSAAFESAAATARNSATAFTIPATLLLSAPDSIQLPKGIDLDIEISVENVGSSDSKFVEITTDSDFDVTVTPNELDSLTGGESTTIQLLGSPTATETSTVTIFVESSDTLETLDIDVSVISRLGYLQRAATQFDELIVNVERIRLGDESQGDGWLRGRRNEIQSLDKRLDQLINRIQTGDSSDSIRRIRQVEERLLKHRDRIERKVNKSDNSKGKGNRQKQEMTLADGRLLASDVTAIVGTLENARNAEV